MSERSRSTVTDLGRGIVASGADATRVSEAADALVDLLLGDERVKAAYQSWLLRMTEDEEKGAAGHPAAILEGLQADITQLVALVDSLGLPYRWLPQRLLVAFCGLADGTEYAWSLASSGELPWAERGRHHRGKAARNVEWFYRHRIKQPADSIVTLASEYSGSAGRRTDARSVVQDGIGTAEALLACIN